MPRKRFLGQAEAIRLPQPHPQPISPTSFAFCPLPWPDMTLGQVLLQQWLYLRALEEAQAVLRPSLPERDLLAVWN